MTHAPPLKARHSTNSRPSTEAPAERLRPSRDPAKGYPILGYPQGLRSSCAVEKSIYSSEYQQLCRLLRELRVEAGLTQKQVADRLQEAQSFVSKYESGERRLDVIELRHVAKALGVPTGTLLSRLDPDWLSTAE